MRPIRTAIGGTEQEQHEDSHTLIKWTISQERNKVTAMTVREALAEGSAALKHHETETPRLDAALLLAHTCGVSRERLYMDLAEPITSSVLKSYRSALDRRLSGEPVAWIIGVKEFWGLRFTVGPGVLCPRPDSEILVESALEVMDGLIPEGSPRTNHLSAVETPHTKDQARCPVGPLSDNQPPLPVGRLHDCCCGPGTLTLALASERPGWEISASDISKDAARYFSENNKNLCAGKIDYFHSDLMEGINGPFEVIVSNPPYLTPAETEERTSLGWREPVLALDGGDSDGLGVIRRLIPRIFNRLIPGGTTLIEANPLQMRQIREILIATGFEDIRIQRDMGNRERVVIARRNKEI